VGQSSAPYQQGGEIILVNAVGNIPHPAKMATGGEDANFMTPNAVGVADGVGGWAAHGIDAGEYARGLMTAAQESVDVHGQTDPLAILWHAYRGVSHLGSSTCLILTLDPQRGILHSANLGDSAFRVIRDGQIHYRYHSNAVFTLFLRCFYAVFTRGLRCFYAVFTRGLRCFYAVFTLFLRCFTRFQR